MSMIEKLALLLAWSRPSDPRFRYTVGYHHSQGEESLIVALSWCCATENLEFAPDDDLADIHARLDAALARARAKNERLHRVRDAVKDSVKEVMLRKLDENGFERVDPQDVEVEVSHATRGPR